MSVPVCVRRCFRAWPTAVKMLEAGRVRPKANLLASPRAWAGADIVIVAI